MAEEDTKSDIASPKSEEAGGEDATMLPPPVPQAAAPVNNHDNDDEEEEEDDEPVKSTKRSLTELEDEGDANDEEGANAAAGSDDEQQQQQSDEEDEDSDDVDRDRPRKKKRRKRAGNQFLDIEADVDEDEDEEEDDVEDGFVAANDDFIVKTRDRGPLRDGVDDDMGEYDDADGDDADGDASHRLLDRRRMAKVDKAAAEEAASFRERYKQNYAVEASDDWAPKALLMPGVNDPSIWGVRCKTGRERDLVLSLSRKAAALAAADNSTGLQIISAFHRDSIKGYLYIEARSEDHVRRAIEGLIGVYAHSPNGVFLVDIEEMPDLLKTKQKKVEIAPGGWVRIKRGKYAGDLAQIIDLNENGEDVALKFIPRIDLTPKDEGLQVGSDGKKRKKGVATPLAFRPPQRFFNSEEISKIYGKKEVVKRPGGIFTFRNDVYKDGYCEKDIRLNALTLEDVQPTIDELTRFLGDAGSTGGDGEGGSGGGLDLSQVADAVRNAAKSILQPGDHVEIFEGDQKGMYGTVESITNDVVIITPHVDLDLEGTKVEVQARSVRKRFKAGDHVKVMNGSNADETGMVVKVQDDIVTFLSDLSMQEVQVFAKDVREAAEVGSGVNVIGQYELHDLVQLDPQTTGVIFKIERDMFRILDQSRTVRLLKPSQISNKVSSRNAVAIDREGFDIRAGDEMEEVSTNQREEPRKGRVLHVYRSLFAFLHNRDYPENGGVFVVHARSLTSTAPKGHKVKPGQGLNPDRFGVAPMPQVQSSGGSGRPDGRIHRKVSVTKGAYKGYAGVIKDVTAGMARVELHTNSKVITINLESLKEQHSDGSLHPLYERPMGAPGYGARQSFNREGSSFSTASNTAPLGQGGNSGRTPAPNYGGRTVAWAGGRTPAPANGGATPMHGAGGGWESGRTPAYQPNNSGDGFAPGSRTPAYRSGNAPQAASDPWSANSRTPFHPSMSAARDSDRNNGGRTPDPRLAFGGGRTPAYGGGRTPAYNQNNGGRTPAYGGKNSYGAGRNDDRGEGPSQTAPTPAAAADNFDAEWDVGAPTPAASKPHDYGGYQPKTPYDAPTPYGAAPTPAAGAPTPAAHYGGAPTPAAYGAAPTPGAYASGPTPGGYGAAATPGAFYQTPYAGAATTAAQPMEYQQRSQTKEGLPSDWPMEGLRVVFVKSDFQGGRLNDQLGGIKATRAGGLCHVLIESNNELVEFVPTASLAPLPPIQAGESCYVLAGSYRNQKAETLSRDGGEWMVQIAGGSTAIIDNHHLALLVES